MATKKVKVEIEGKSALIMHWFPLEPIEAIEKKTPEEQAEIAAYRIPAGNDNAGNLYVPGVAVLQALISGATYSKGKFHVGIYLKGKGRASLQKPALACLKVTPEYLDLGIKEYVIDSCAVVVNKGRIVRHRPRIDHWKCKFELEYDDVLLTANQVRKIVDDAGERCGLLDYRPSKKGPFGRFCVVERFCVIHWEAI
jgi:hypothetical protein